MSQQLEICTLFYEQTVCRRGTKMEKGSLDDESKMMIAMLAVLFNTKAGDNICIVQRTEVKDGNNGFLGLSCDTPWLHLIDIPTL